MIEPVVTLQGVSKRFDRPLDLASRAANLVGAGLQPTRIHAVDQVDLAIAPGEVVGVAGESGCGKSTLGRLIAGIHAPSEGTIRFCGTGLGRPGGEGQSGATLKVQLIFQDPMASLNPRMRVIDLIGEAPVVHGLIPRADKRQYVEGLLAQVGLDPGYCSRFPHQFSGGQRARIGIARALAVRPEFLVCDEPVAALDVSIQAQVLNLFMQLKRDLGLTYLFISHDLGVVQHICDRIAIMYLGRIVELAPTDALFRTPNHPYTQALLADRPSLEPGKRRFKAIEGEIPSPAHRPSGCHFHPRCPHAMPRCRVESPELKEIAAGRQSACHLNDVVPEADAGSR
jgi:peptide/nickel transport system ATP-binding protein